MREVFKKKVMDHHPSSHPYLGQNGLWLSIYSKDLLQVTIGLPIPMVKHGLDSKEQFDIVRYSSRVLVDRGE